jgi:hypothetical protein
LPSIFYHACYKKSEGILAPEVIRAPSASVDALSILEEASSHLFLKLPDFFKKGGTFQVPDEGAKIIPGGERLLLPSKLMGFFLSRGLVLFACS